MLTCPRKCDPEYLQRMPEKDTHNSQAYLCCACGKLFYLFVGLVKK